MTLANTPRAYGWLARFFHWTIAALILGAIGLGLYAASLPQGSEADLQRLFAAFSVHKTLGVTVLALAVLRILWTLTQTKPRPLHPGRWVETFLAEAVHWGLWIGMVLMPLTGWLLHSAAPGGFSRILWPFGQRLPGIAEDAHLAERFAAFHETGWWVLAALIALHVAGALKHVLIDRDGTLARMAGPMAQAPEPPAAPVHRAARRGVWTHMLAAFCGVMIWAATALIATPEAGATPDAAVAPTATTSESAPPEAAPSGWTVREGQLTIEVMQGGKPIQGAFDTWRARIDYDPESQSGAVTVEIDLASLSLGSVSDSAKGPDFLNAAAHPTATFSAEILPPEPGGAMHMARGALTLAGKTVEATLPFALDVAGDTAKAKGEMRVDRRDFGIGAGYPDESTVGFGVTIRFDLVAEQQ